MSKLNLYILLHGNLGFSAIPKDQYSKVLDVSYWPILNLIEQGYPMGIEFPADTLLEINEIDPSFISKLKQLWNSNKCDVIGSGLTQTIMPLLPYEINYKNIELGIEAYNGLLGKIPEILFLNEQTFSTGMKTILKEFNFNAFIMDWDNAAEHHALQVEDRYKPAKIKLTSKKDMHVIWNSSMNSYKFQRYIYGRISLQDYLNGILEHISKTNNRAMCLYGTDWEIFNFRPLTHETSSREVERVKIAIEAIQGHKNTSFILPSEVIKATGTGNYADISSAQIPIPCKNRDDYNVVRWAVSGRDNVQQNTKCFELYSEIKKLSFSNVTEKELNSLWKDLIRLWGSDYRTKTTNEKFYTFWNNLGKTFYKIKKKQAAYHSKRSKIKDTIFIYNPSDQDLKNHIVELPLKFPKGKFKSLIGIVVEDLHIKSQCEDIEYYQDHSIRQCMLIFTIDIKPKQKMTAKLHPVLSPESEAYTIRVNGPEIIIKTSHAELSLNTSTGADIKSLKFPKVHDTPLVKYLPPVYFDNIGYSNDYFSGWTQLCTKDRQVFNDTTPTTFQPDQNYFTIRIPIHFKHPFYNGFIKKRYNVYFNHSRVELINHFYFPSITPVFLRTGITTINPESFNLNHLAYSTVNGGKTHETFRLKGKKVTHSAFPSQQCSSTSCLGSTEGWTMIHDKNKGLAFLSDKSELYSAPMIEFEEVKKSWLLRVHHSIAESDDTGSVSFQGHNKVRIIYQGIKGDNSKFKSLKQINMPLIVEYNPE